MSAIFYRPTLAVLALRLGGAADTLARIVGQRLGERLHAQVIVDIHQILSRGEIIERDRLGQPLRRIESPALCTITHGERRA